MANRSTRIVLITFSNNVKAPLRARLDGWAEWRKNKNSRFVDGAGGLNPPAPKVVFVVIFSALLANAEWHVRCMRCRQTISNAAKCVPVKSRRRSNGGGTIRFGRISARVDSATATPGEGSGNRRLPIDRCIVGAFAKSRREAASGARAATCAATACPDKS
jgi:hypothetical protein